MGLGRYTATELSMVEDAALLALNHLLAQSSWARQRLMPFCGRSATVTMVPWRIQFTVGDGGVLVATQPGESVFDVDIVLPSDAPIRLLQGSESLMRAAHIQGSADFAEALGFVLGRLHWDAEEDLSKLVGDLAARRIVGGVESFLAWHRQALRNVAENLSEYFTHEVHALVRSEQLHDFGSGVVALSEDLQRIEIRLQRLARI
jgi:ubiquinone biosynthesis protein UbiJ